MEWTSDAEALVEAQRQLAVAEPELWHPHGRLVIGACWICFERGLVGRGEPGDRAWAAATVLEGRKSVASAVVSGTAGAAYEPGLLALREGPLLESAVRALSQRPEVLLVNASGRDHPRRAGLALHLGGVLDVPTVGVTHRPLVAVGAWPDARRGSTSPLTIDAEPVALWLRARLGTRPLVVHPGWRTDLDTAVEVVRYSLRRARTPEPLRRARRLARLARAGRVEGLPVTASDL